MREVLRSAVNTWDCDHMGHLNVRHYLRHSKHGLNVLLLQLGLPPETCKERGLVVRARDQHLRFRQELRPGTSFTVQAGIVANEPSLIAYEEMRTLQGEVSATIVSELALFESRTGSEAAWPEALLEAARQERCAVPPYAAVRSVTETPTRKRIRHDQALKMGLMPGFLGAVTVSDCDASGLMHEAGCMALIADGISHTFRALYGLVERPPGIGGAALEYRFVFHSWPQLDQLVEVRSGVSSLGSKTIQLTHHLFELASGACFATAQAVIAWFDLDARKTVALPDDLRALVADKLIEGLSL